MKRLASIVALLLLLSTAAPVLACTTGSDMSRSESACCRSMHHDCGEMAKTGCCRTEAGSDEQPQIATAVPSLELQLAIVDWLQPAFNSVQIVPSFFLNVPADHSPPGLLIARTTILRI